MRENVKKKRRGTGAGWAIYVNKVHGGGTSRAAAAIYLTVPTCPCLTVPPAPTQGRYPDELGPSFPRHPSASLPFSPVVPLAPVSLENGPEFEVGKSRCVLGRKEGTSPRLIIKKAHFLPV